MTAETEVTADDSNDPLIRADLFLLVALGAFAALALLYVLPVLSPAGMLLVEDYVAETVFLSLTVTLFATAAICGRDTATRSFWWLMTAAFLAWLLSQVLGYFIRDDAPSLHNFIKDLLLLAMSCLAVVAVDLQPGFIKSSMQTLRARLAALSSVLLIVGVFGYAALVPALAGIETYTSPFAVYSFLDAYIAIRFFLQAVATRNRPWRVILLLVGAGFGLISMADLLVFAFNSGWLDYAPGQPLNLAWFLLYLPLFAASRVRAGRAPVLPPSAHVDWSRSLSLAPLLTYSVAIPIVHLSGYGLGLLAVESRTVRDLFVLGWLLATTAGMTWQYLLLRNRLNAAEAARVRAERESTELQGQLRQAQRIELVGQLTGGLAHEFGNSLFGAESFAQKILRDARNQHDDGQEQHALGLISALSGSRELVRKFNYLGRGEDLESTVVNVVEEVRTTLDLLRPGISKGIKLDFHCDVDDIGAIARKQDLQQITLNLVLNARDAIGEQGFIDVNIGQGAPGPEHCASCGALAAGEYVRIRVSDSGPGIPDDLRQRIFEPLVSSKPPGQGSGLGLSIVHTLVHQLRGHIVLGDRLAAHCSFTVLLPAVELGVAHGQPRASTGSHHLLVFESDQQLANNVRRNRALHDLHIDHVASVEAACVILQQQDRCPDAVLIGNIDNPLDVVAVIEAAQSAEQPVRVILCARRSQKAVLANLDGIDVFLDQPVDADIFASTIMRNVNA